MTIFFFFFWCLERNYDFDSKWCGSSVCVGSYCESGDWSEFVEYRIYTL